MARELREVAQLLVDEYGWSALDDRVRVACPVCAAWTRAYLHHLVRSGEILGAILMTEHNLFFYQALMADLRSAIAESRLAAFAASFRYRYGARENGGNA